jgi:hypothetical protein
MPDIPAIDGLADASDARVMLYQSGRQVHAPTLAIGLQPAGSYQPLDADLTALAGNATNGLWAHTGAGTGAARTITGTAPINVTNGDGVAGNPSIALSAHVASVALQVFTASGTYTPNAKMIYCEVFAFGGGGAGGGAPATAAGQLSVGSGGHAGAKSYGIFSAGAIGASQAVTIPAAATGVAGGNGNAGGAVTFGTLISAAGGPGGVATLGGAPPFSGVMQGAAQSATGQVRGWTVPGHVPNVMTAGGGTWISGGGGSNEWGGGAAGVGPNAAGNAGNGSTGAGGSGAANIASQPARAGGNGAQGILIVKEYLSF